jgi:heme exporter protein A
VLAEHARGRQRGLHCVVAAREDERHACGVRVVERGVERARGRRVARGHGGHVEHEGALALADARPALDAHRPLGEALDFWRRIDRAGEARADFGLADLHDVPVRYLSTGQRKRAALARLAASGAQIWLLDEPLNGLDTHWGASTQAAIEAHRVLGGIAVIASHQPLHLQGLRTLSLLDHMA